MKKVLSTVAGAAAIALCSWHASGDTPLDNVREMIESGKAVRQPFKTHKPHRNGTIHGITAKARVSALPDDNTQVFLSTTPKKITSGGSNVLAYLGYTNSESNPIGLYTMDPSGYTLSWADALYESDGLALGCGWLRDDMLCGFAPVEFFGYIYNIYYIEYDLSSGDVKLDREASMKNGIFSSATINPDDGNIYGFGSHPDHGYSFLKAPATEPDAIEFVKSWQDDEANMCISISYNSDDHKLYGINMAGNLVSIATDGLQNIVMPISEELKTDYICGMTYSPTEKTFYWNRVDDSTSGLYTINPTSASVTLSQEFSNLESFPVLMCNDSPIDASAPSEARFSDADFPEGAVSGTVTYTLPSTTEGGAALDGNLDWVATIDNAEHSYGTGKAGNDVIVSFNNLSEGMHTFGFFTKSGNLESRRNTDRLFIGNDEPQAPSNVVLKENSVSWDAVTSGIHGGYVNISGMYYDVYINGVKAGSTQDTSMPVTIPSDLPLDSYSACVVAVSNGKESAPGVSNNVICGKPFEPDVRFEPTAAEAVLFTITDSQSDGYTWFFDPDMYDKQTFSTAYDPYKAMDDWLFLPAINFSDSEKYYTFELSGRRRGNYRDQDFIEIKFGSAPSPEAMSGTILQKTQPEYFTDWDEWGEYGGMFKVPSAGIYYIGIHCISDADQYGVVVRDFRVKNPGITADSPTAASSVSATPAENGLLEATVSFRIPSVTIENAPIATEKILTAVVTGENEVTVSGQPGEMVSATVRTVQGDNTITVTVSDGNARGVPATVQVFTGVHIPDVITELTGSISEDMHSFTLSWSAPSKGEDGGYIDPATVEYTAYGYDETWGWQPITPLGAVTTYTFSLPHGSAQDLYRIGIVTSNAAGSGSRVTALTAILGTPYTLPMAETFEGEPDEPFGINPWTYYTPDSSFDGQRWSVEKLASISSEWSSETTSALVGTSRDTGGRGKMSLPRFSTANVSGAEIMLDIWSGKNAARTSVSGYTFSNQTEVTIGEVPSGNGWRKHTIPLPASFNNQSWVQLFIVAEYPGSTDFCVIESLEVKGDVTGVENTEYPSGKIYAADGGIAVEGFEGMEIEVYGVGGIYVFRTSKASDREFINIPGGLYIVKAGSIARKVSVR